MNEWNHADFFHAVKDVCQEDLMLLECTSEKFLWPCVCVCVWKWMGSRAGVHVQSIRLIMRSEGCHYGRPWAVQCLLFRKEHRCLLASEPMCTSLTFCGNTTACRRHLLLSDVPLATVTKANKPLCLLWGEKCKLFWLEVNFSRQLFIQIKSVAFEELQVGRRVVTSEGFHISL